CESAVPENSKSRQLVELPFGQPLGFGPGEHLGDDDLAEAALGPCDTGKDLQDDFSAAGGVDRDGRRGGQRESMCRHAVVASPAVDRLGGLLAKVVEDVRPPALAATAVLDHSLELGVLVPLAFLEVGKVDLEVARRARPVDHADGIAAKWRNVVNRQLGGQ